MTRAIVHSVYAYYVGESERSCSIQAKNSTAESKNHAAGKNTAHSECEIQGASPKSKHPDDFSKFHKALWLTVKHDSD